MLTGRQFFFGADYRQNFAKSLIRKVNIKCYGSCSIQKGPGLIALRTIDMEVLCSAKWEVYIFKL